MPDTAAFYALERFSDRLLGIVESKIRESPFYFGSTQFINNTFAVKYPDSME